MALGLGLRLGLAGRRGTPAPAPTATPNALWLGDAIDDFTNATSPAELNGRLAGPSGQWTANSNGLWQTYTESNSLGSIIRQVNFNAAGPAKLINTLDPTDGWGADLLYEVDWTAEYTTDPAYTGDATDANLPSPTTWTIYNTGTTDYISLTLDLTLNRLTVTPRVDGTSLTAKAWSFTSTVFAKRGRAKLTFLVRNACIWVAIDGVWWDRWSYSGVTAQPRNYADLRADFPLAKRKGVITFENAARRNPRAMGVAVALKSKVTIADDNGYKPILTPSVSNATGADTPQSHTITWEGPEPPCFFGQVTRTAGGGSTSAQGVMRIYPATILTRDRFGGTAQIDWMCPPDSTLYDADSDGTPETPEGEHQLQITYNAMPLFHAAKQLSDTHSEVIIRGTYDGTPEAWFVQVFNGDRGTLTGDPIFSTTQVTPTKAANGQYELRVNVPIALRTYVAHVSYNESGKRFGAYSRRFICGHQVEIFGQSNASGRANATWSGTADLASLATSYVYPLFGSTYTSTAQYLNYAARPNDTFTRNTMWEMARVLTEKTGVPWAVFHSGHGGSPMYSFLSTSSGGAGSVNYHELLARRAAAGNRASVMIVDQGEAEATSPFASEVEGWPEAANQMLEEVRALYGNPTLKCGVTAIGKYATDQFGGTGPISSGRGYARMRAQQYSMPSRYPGKFFMSTWRGGEGRADQLHFNAAGHQEDCQRGAYSILASVIGQSIPDGMGPAITAATLVSSGVVDLIIDPRGYDSITGSAITGYIYSTNGGSTWLNPSSVEIVSGKIRVSGTGLAVGSIIRSYDNWDWSNGIAWPGGSDSSMARGVYAADGRTNVPVQAIIGSWSGSTFTDAGLVVA